MREAVRWKHESTPRRGAEGGHTGVLPGPVQLSSSLLHDLLFYRLLHYSQHTTSVLKKMCLITPFTKLLIPKCCNSSAVLQSSKIFSTYLFRYIQNLSSYTYSAYLLHNSVIFLLWIQLFIRKKVPLHCEITLVSHVMQCFHHLPN
jgi:hypothetical protein